METLYTEKAYVIPLLLVGSDLKPTSNLVPNDLQTITVRLILSTNPAIIITLASGVISDLTGVTTPQTFGDFLISETEIKFVITSSHITNDGIYEVEVDVTTDEGLNLGITPETCQLLFQIR